MELLLALAVITAVIIFGALISLGNERQRRAIEELREQVVLWAIQDLRIKREHLVREVRVEDPIGWLNQIAGKICGYNLELCVVEVLDTPHALICTTGDRTGRVIFTPCSPKDLRRYRKEKPGRLSQIVAESPLYSLPRNAASFEITALNSGMMFELELPAAWGGLTGRTAVQMDRVWMYMV